MDPEARDRLFLTLGTLCWSIRLAAQLFTNAARQTVLEVRGRCSCDTKVRACLLCWTNWAMVSYQILATLSMTAAEYHLEYQFFAIYVQPYLSIFAYIVLVYQVFKYEMMLSFTWACAATTCPAFFAVMATLLGSIVFDGPYKLDPSLIFAIAMAAISVLLGYLPLLFEALIHSGRSPSVGFKSILGIAGCLFCLLNRGFGADEVAHVAAIAVYSVACGCETLLLLSHFAWHADSLMTYLNPYSRVRREEAYTRRSDLP
ncbi:hypothetical protein F5Y15DRAFT_160724 [Xylariaceae sp. FL0016]|nr:hypothetical protein F5Y15DRAFT_160724 [Xylariaceae sp. FL0016]